MAEKYSIKIRKIFRDFRVILLLVMLLLAIISINPRPWNKGVVILAVEKDSPAWLAGIRAPTEDVRPLSRERILEINGEPIKNVEDYYRIEQNLPYNVTVMIKTNKNVYTLKYVWKNTTRSNITKKGLGIIVTNAPKNNIRKGLDLVGGIRVLLAPSENASREDILTAVDIIRQRMNVYGLSDVSVTYTEVGNNYYILLEIPGATEEQVRKLISTQGKFEAKIGNITVFKGGKDITYVCRTADCSGLDLSRPCRQLDVNQWVCGFRFAIAITPEAAKRQANVTSRLSVINEGDFSYLNETIDFYLDDEKVDSLRIGAELKGNPTTQISISGSGQGRTLEEARKNTLQEMRRLQTILLTGSLPVKLTILEMNHISPVLGEQFLSTILWVGLLAILVVAFILFIRYRKLEISIPVIITMLSEVTLILGFAAMINWRLDIAAIAGILIAIGSGVDDQIVIADELTGKAHKFVRNWKERIKNAFFIVFGSYFTTVGAMIPLWSAGATLLRGFALTTIAGVTFGVLITRPAFTAIVEKLLKD